MFFWCLLQCGQFTIELVTWLKTWLEQCASPWFTVTSVFTKIQCHRYQSITSLQYSWVKKKKKKGRDIFELFCHKSIFFEVSERASSAVYEHIRMRKCLGDARRRSLQESSAKTVSLLQPFWRAEILRTEAKDQIKVVYISFIQGSWLLLHLTIMEFFICWERLNWLYAKTVVWIFL